VEHRLEGGDVSEIVVVVVVVEASFFLAF